MMTKQSVSRFAWRVIMRRVILLGVLAVVLISGIFVSTLPGSTRAQGGDTGMPGTPTLCLEASATPTTTEASPSLAMASTPIAGTPEASPMDCPVEVTVGTPAT
jgi:hypothetical protein